MTPAVYGAGAASLDAHVDGVEGELPEHRYQPHAPPRSMVGPPLAEVTAHRITDPDHWHLVTRGLSELGDASSFADDESSPGGPDASGWGFELTFRIAGTDSEPLWAVDLLTNLAAYVWSSDHPFAEGHHLDLRGPIRLDSSSAITAAVVTLDPTLGVLAGPHGTVEFLQIVGLRIEELELCRSWSTDAVVDLLAKSDPLLICRLDRPSLLEDLDVQAEISARATSEGSALTELRVATMSWRGRRRGRTVEVHLGSGASAALGPALRRELIGRDASFQVVGNHQQIRFTVASQPRWTATDDILEVAVPPGEVEGLADLFDGRIGWGRRPAWPRLRFHVKP
ncbi:MAG: suppressor of fused domain protein [Actinomycetota bacterium]|nr:suppressor of fused domain protein [Actinomycetota bacterium]